MFLCNFSIFTFDVHTLNIVLGSLIGFGDLSLIGVHILDVNSFKKECSINNKKSMSLLEDSLEEAYLDNEITKLKKDIKEIDEKISKLDEVIVKEEPKEEIDYKSLKRNKYMSFTEEMSKPKQKYLKK